MKQKRAKKGADTKVNRLFIIMHFAAGKNILKRIFLTVSKLIKRINERLVASYEVRAHV